jgi:hypothetical protein
MGVCKGLLTMMAEKDVVIEDKEGQTYLDMAENLKPRDVSQVLQLALKSGKVEILPMLTLKMKLEPTHQSH